MAKPLWCTKGKANPQRDVVVAKNLGPACWGALFEQAANPDGGGLGSGAHWHPPFLLLQVCRLEPRFGAEQPQAYRQIPA